MATASATLVPADPAVEKAEVDEEVCIPEHCFHAFDTLYCELTSRERIPPKFPDEK